MENKLDKLFRDKLAHQSLQPSSQAWEKLVLGTSTSSSKSRFVWGWRIAAVIAMAGLIGWYASDQAVSSEQLPMAKETLDGKKQEILKDELNTNQQKVSDNAIVVPVNPKAKSESSEQQKRLDQPMSKRNNPAVQLALAEEVGVLDEPEQPVEIIASVEEEIIPAVIAEPTVKSAQEKTMVIVYSLASVEAQPQVVVEKTNGLKRAIAFAKDVKGGETTLASVRDWKDNFFGSDEQARVEKQNNN